MYKSKNIHSHFRRVGRIVCDKISGIDGVVGIIATGGIARKFSDDFSDLDFFVYADKSKARQIASYIAVGQLCYKDIHFDIPVLSYQRAMRHKVPSNYWSQVIRWTLKYGEIWYDPDGKVKSLLDKKLIFPESEQKLLLNRYHHRVDEILNYIYSTWEARGYIWNLAHLLRRAAENMILWVYVKNELFQPYVTKWLYFYFENNLIPEAKYFSNIRHAFTTPVENQKQAAQLRERLFRLCDKFEMNIKKENLNDVIAKNIQNWEKASDKTKEFLSF
ncbi:MAG: hypothetical protein V3V99_10095 [candidate division Zixibacteria bacterium]